MEVLEIKEISSGKIDYRTLKRLQPENYKKLSQRGFDRMFKSLMTNGFRVPFYVWEDGEDVYILDGHQRRSFLVKLLEMNIPIVFNGHETFEIPVVYIFAESKKNAIEMLLSIDSEYGDRNIEAMLDFIEENEIERTWVEENVSMPIFDEFMEI